VSIAQLCESIHDYLQIVEGELFKGDIQSSTLYAGIVQRQVNLLNSKLYERLHQETRALAARVSPAKPKPI
jgi:hypothetical protein